MGLGLPVDLETESVTIGISIQTQFSTPTNLSKLWSHLADPFDVLHRSSAKRSIEKDHIRNLSDDYDEQMNSFQKYATESNFLDHTDSRKTNSLASMRWTIYKAFAEIAERFVIHT